MEEPISTPQIRAFATKQDTNAIPNDQIFSSSPGFGTPAYPITSRPPAVVRHPFRPQVNTATISASIILPVLVPPQTLRPIAFRTLTKKHNLTLTSSGLGLISLFIGKFCGSGWRDEGLAERVLDEVAKLWKNQGGGVLVEDGPGKKLTAILKSLEPCMSGGRIDAGKLSRTNSYVSGSVLSRSGSVTVRQELNRDDSQDSIGLSGLEVNDELPDDEDEATKGHRDSRAYLKVISAFQQPRFTYSVTKKTLEVINKEPSLIPPIQNKTLAFRHRYHLVHQRLMRNEAFQAPSFSVRSGPPSLVHSESGAATIQQAYRITPISNLLGRSGSSHLLLGILVNSAVGDLAVSDLSGSVVLDITFARTVPDDGAWFCPGMIVLIDGVYDEDGSNNSNLGSSSGIGGQIKGRFVANTFASPPAERRDVTLGIGNNIKTENGQNNIGAGFGWIDFLGTGSEKAAGQQMRKIHRKILGCSSNDSEGSRRTKMIIIGECHLDCPRVIESLRSILSTYARSGQIRNYPLSIVLLGNFVSAASIAGSSQGGGSVEYKEYFDALASMLTEFPSILSTTTIVFVPGDNDPWTSSFTSGAATTLPRHSIPDLFTSRIRRAITNANSESGKRDSEVMGEAIWTSNPSRLTLFGSTEEIILFRDDITGRLRRNAVVFPKLQTEDQENTNVNETQGPTSDQTNKMEIDIAVQEATSHMPDLVSETITRVGIPKADTATARKVVKTMLDQGYLAPFPLSIRPVLWDYASVLSVYPLPTAMVLADAESPAFTITYEGCHVMNPGRVIDDLGMRKGIAKWIEYDVKTSRGVLREVRF